MREESDSEMLSICSFPAKLRVNKLADFFDVRFEEDRRDYIQYSFRVDTGLSISSLAAACVDK